MAGGVQRGGGCQILWQNLKEIQLRPREWGVIDRVEDNTDRTQAYRVFRTGCGLGVTEPKEQICLFP